MSVLRRCFVCADANEIATHSAQRSGKAAAADSAVSRQEKVVNRHAPGDVHQSDL
jgi:hypothetical protein